MLAHLPGIGRPSFALRTDSTLAQLAAIRAGFGIGLCQAAVARRDPTLVRVLDSGSLKLPLWIVMHEDLRTIDRYRVVFDALVETLVLDAPGASQRRPGLARTQAGTSRSDRPAGRST